MSVRSRPVASGCGRDQVIMMRILVGDEIGAEVGRAGGVGIGVERRPAAASPPPRSPAASRCVRPQFLGPAHLWCEMTTGILARLGRRPASRRSSRAPARISLAHMRRVDAAMLGEARRDARPPRRCRRPRWSDRRGRSRSRPRRSPSPRRHGRASRRSPPSLALTRMSDMVARRSAEWPISAATLTPGTVSAIALRVVGEGRELVGLARAEQVHRRRRVAGEGHRREADAAIAGDDRRHALADLRQHVRRVEHDAVVVRVRVDEARRRARGR